MGNVADIFIWLKKRERWVKLVRNYAREVEKQVRMFSCTYDEKKTRVGIQTTLWKGKRNDSKVSNG